MYFIYTFQQSNVIYQFSCSCDSRYVGRISQRLQDRIKQDVPKSIRNSTCSQTRIQPKRDCTSSTQLPTTQLFCDSAIGLHLFAIPSAHKITMTNNSLFLPKVATLSIYQS